MTYNIIQHKGRQNQAVTDKGDIVKRAESFFTEEYGISPVTDYDDHFIYENKEVGQSSFMCTCGSVSVIVSSGMFVCLNHATFGFHQTSQVNKKDFETGDPIIRKGKKWA